MKTQEQVLQAFKSKERECETLDGRDISRLVDFFPVETWSTFGATPRDGVTVPPPKPWTREEVLEQLRADVAFGFEKALDKRGISASCMWCVVSMWLWVLEEELPEDDEDRYAQYGLPLLKATAIRFGFDNPIGEDRGTEAKYG